MLLIQIRSKVPNERIEPLLGKRGKPSDFGLCLTETGSVYKPDGERLVTLLRGAVSEDAARRAYPFLHWLRRYRTMNRGNYSGADRFRRTKADGTLSNTNHAEPVRSAIAGFFDRNPRFPYCRETNFTTQRVDDWVECRPFIEEAARAFEKHAVKRYEAQQKAALKTHPAYVIPGTPFTTITVNNCVAGGFHRDAGDYKPGFGVMAVFRRGIYRGCHLGFPAYGVSVDMQDRDVVLFDPHEIHGNTPFTDQVGEEGEDWERISVVMYFRERMVECLPPDEERERAKHLRGAIDFDSDARGDGGGD